MGTKEEIKLEFLERFKKKAKARLKFTKASDHGLPKKIADTTGIEAGTVRKWFRDGSIPDAEQLIKIFNGLGITPNYLLLGINDETTTPQSLTVGSAIQTILDHIENPAILQEDTELISLPIFQFNGTGNETTDRLILQSEVSGRRKNIVPIRIDSEEKMNILLLVKRKARGGE